MKTISEEDIALLRHLVCDLDFARNEALGGRFNAMAHLLNAVEEKLLCVLANVENSDPPKT